MAAGDAVLQFGTSTTPNNLDPHRTSFPSDCTYLCPAYDRLVHVDPDGSLIPGLAESWEFSQDGLKLTFHIRKGVAFKDGTVLDGEAVKASLLRARDLPESAVKSDFATVADVTVDDPQTVTLSLSAPNAAMPAILSGLAGAVINPTALAMGVNLSETLDGAGAFRFVSYTTGSELKLERNPDYWGEAPGLAGIDFKIVTDPAALANALLAGQVDTALVLSQNIGPFKDNGDFTVKAETVLFQTAMLANFKIAGLTDERVRQALLHGIDRESICETLYAGFCKVSDQPFPPGYFAYDESLPDVLYPYDPEKAKALLTEAGEADLSITAIVPGANYTQLAQVIKEQLKEIGVNMEILPLDNSAMAQKFIVDKTGEMVITGVVGRSDPSQLFASRFSEKGVFNPGGFVTPELDELLADSLAVTDPDERRAVLQAASREAAESALSLMLNFPARIYVMKKGVDFDVYLSGLQEISGATKVD
ncbi:ABC transporter substrate-binding protein [Arthrobacter sp. D1-29]